MVCKHCGSKNVIMDTNWCETTITCRDCKKETVEESEDFSVEELFSVFEDEDLMDIIDETIDPEQIKEAFKIIDENAIVESIDTMVDSIAKMMEKESDKK